MVVRVCLRLGLSPKTSPRGADAETTRRYARMMNSNSTFLKFLLWVKNILSRVGIGNFRGRDYGSRGENDFWREIHFCALRKGKYKSIGNYEESITDEFTYGSMIVTFV